MHESATNPAKYAEAHHQRAFCAADRFADAVADASAVVRLTIGIPDCFANASAVRLTVGIPDRFANAVANTSAVGLTVSIPDRFADAVAELNPELNPERSSVFRANLGTDVCSYCSQRLPVHI